MSNLLTYTPFAAVFISLCSLVVAGLSLRISAMNRRKDDELKRTQAVTTILLREIELRNTFRELRARITAAKQNLTKYGFPTNDVDDISAEVDRKEDAIGLLIKMLVDEKQALYWSSKDLNTMNSGTEVIFAEMSWAAGRLQEMEDKLAAASNKQP